MKTREELEAALRKSRLRYNSFLKAVNGYVYHVEILNGEVVGTEHDEGCVNITGYTPREYEDDPHLWHRMIHEEDRESVLTCISMLLEGRQCEPFEHRIVHKNGKVRWVRNHPVLRFDEHGRLAGYDALIIDITQRKHAEIQEKRLRRRLETQWEIALHQDKNLQGVADHINEKMRALTGSQFAFFSLVHDNEKKCTTYAWSENVMEQCGVSSCPWSFSIEEGGLWAEAVRQRKPLVINDYGAEHLAKKGTPPGHVKIKNFLAVPVCSGKRIVALGAVANSPAGYHPDTVDELSAFLANIRILLEQKVVEEELGSVQRALKTLSAANEILVRAKSEKRLLAELCRIVVETGGYSFAWVGYPQRTKEKKVKPIQWAGPHADYLRNVRITWDDSEYGRGPTGTAIRTGKTVICSSLAETPWRDLASEKGFVSSIALPLKSGPQVFGSLNIYSNENNVFQEKEVELLEELAADMAYGIKSLRTKKARRKASRELVKKTAQFETIFRTLPEGLLFIDLKQRIVLVNPALCAMSGYSPGELQGRKSSIFYQTNEEYEEQVQRYSAMGKNEPSDVYEITFLRKDGSTFPAERLDTPVLDQGGKNIGLLSIIRDISKCKEDERVQQELETQVRQLQKMESIGTLAGGIAHDFNNILSIILGYGDMLKHEVPEKDDEMRELLEAVLLAGHRAKDLVKQILTFSRQTEEERLPLQSHLVVKEILKLLKGAIPSTVKIVEKIDTQCGAILANPTEIHQVVMNLCTNAYQSMGDRGGTLEVSLERVELTGDPAKINPMLGEGEYVLLSVKDTGKGMDDAVLERIFEPYYTTKPPGEGTGLGLAVTHGIVESLQGAILVRSAPGRGSVFEVYLPAIDSGLQASPGENEVDGELHGKERILLVDDEVYLAELGQRALQHYGYEVTVRTSSVEALELMKNKPDFFDLLVTDQMMPNLTGTELVREVKKLRKNLPVVLLTGFSDRMALAQARTIGIDEIVMKPVLKKELVATVRRVVDKAR